MNSMEMGFRPDPEKLEQAKKDMEVAVGYFKLWNELAEGKELQIPTDDPEQAKIYIEKMEELRTIFEARYSEEQKQEIFPRVDAYIEKLKEIN